MSFILLLDIQSHIHYSFVSFKKDHYDIAVVIGTFRKPATHFKVIMDGILRFTFFFSEKWQPLLSWGVSVRMYPRSSTKCVVALTPDDKADQRVPRDKSGAQAPKIVLAPSRQYPSSDTLCCRGILGLSPSVYMLMLLVSVRRTIWISLKYTVNEPPWSPL